ncbi:MAG: hypothetical protein BGWL_c4110 [Candidatus Phytoplasma cynodontis]|uniref:hypothetical protein n=1 Tax='Cynodon dactylon' phytoplasma TaxID=295320 RepID=UPI001265C3B4|nr:hypothetical protein ['Cynodon dactylon' phytoplasma]KAB8122101.1 hypothetical protein F1741_01000 ['Cynodon dactylon' phytoplasma]WIA07893.1 MAG: hypothetical protein BGWL_c4110 [Candidatus Phytoplasma cynodontis]
MLKKIFYKKFKIKLFSSIFDGILKDEKPFIENEFFLDGKKIKIEFFYLCQNKYNSYCLEIKQYIVWTIKDNICRVFIDKNYYCDFKEFYQIKVNIIYVDFLYKILEKRRYLIYNNILYFIFFSFFFLFFFFCGKIYFNYKQFLFFSFCFIICCLLFFFFFNKKQKKIFYDFKKNIFDITIKKTKNYLGEEKFENILKKQKSFFS